MRNASKLETLPWAESPVRLTVSPCGKSHVIDELVVPIAKTSDYFTLLASGFALVSDGYQNSLSTVFNAIYVRVLTGDTKTNPLTGGKCRKSSIRYITLRPSPHGSATPSSSVVSSVQRPDICSSVEDISRGPRSGRRRFDL